MRDEARRHFAGFCARPFRLLWGLLRKTLHFWQDDDMATASPKKYMLILVAVPTFPLKPDENTRLKQLLKQALRRFGFRCERVEAMRSESAGAAVRRL